jgi:hypothetical protein
MAIVQSPRESVGDFMDREAAYHSALAEIRALPESEHGEPGIALARFLDSAMYWTAMAWLYVAYGFLWYYGAKEKLFDHSGSMVLGVLDATVLALFLASLVAREFLPHRRKPILLCGLVGSMVVFAAMTFGDSLASNYAGIGLLFVFMGATGAAYGVLRLVPMFSRT